MGDYVHMTFVFKFKSSQNVNRVMSRDILLLALPTHTHTLSLSLTQLFFGASLELLYRINPLIIHLFCVCVCVFL